MYIQLAHALFYLALAGMFVTMILIIIKERRSGESKTGNNKNKSRKDGKPYIESERLHTD